MVIHADGGDEPVLIDIDFDDFYGRGYRKCAALGFALTGSVADADDLAQEAFATAYRRWSEISGYDDPLAWVCKVMINNAMSRGRRLRREVIALARFGGRPKPPVLELGSADRELWTLVSKLPKQQAAAVALHYLDDLSVEAIAEVMGCSSGTVKTHLARGRQSLASQLSASKENSTDD